MTWGLAKFLGGVALGALLVGLVAKLRKLMRIKTETREQTDMTIRNMNLEALKWVRSLSDEQFLEEWKKHSEGRGGAE